MDNLPIAMRIAARILVIDNTGREFRLLYVRQQGKKPTIAQSLPAWAIKAIPQDLR